MPVIEKFTTLHPQKSPKRILKSKLLTALGATGVLAPFPANPEHILERKILLQNTFSPNPVTPPAGAGLLVGIRAYWMMDENVASGSRADATGNGFTATDPNANVASSNAALIVNCANIDTIAKGLSVSNTIDTRAQTTPFSISFWFRQVDVRAGNSAIANLASGGTSGYLIYANSQSPTTTLHYYSGTDGNVVTDNNTATNIDPANFNHVVFGYDGTFKFIYLNGVNLFNNIAVAGVSRTASPLVIGNYSPIGATTGLAARYDEIGYWTRVLTNAEVIRIYNGGAGIPFSSYSM